MRSNPVTNERVVLQVVHWSVVLLICGFTLVLAMRRDLDAPSVTALFGTALGHVGTVAAHRTTFRSTDPSESNDER